MISAQNWDIQAQMKINVLTVSILSCRIIIITSIREMSEGMGRLRDWDIQAQMMAFTTNKSPHCVMYLFLLKYHRDRRVAQVVEAFQPGFEDFSKL